MKKNILPIFGLLALILASCAGTATQTQPPPVSPPATKTSLPPTISVMAILPTETAIPVTDTAIPVSSTPASSSGVSFAKDVMPILNDRCNKCHGVEDVKKGLDMTSYDNLMAGSFNGPVVIPGNGTDSLLIDLIVRGKMPKRGEKLAADEIQLLIDWINAGALNN